VRSALRPRNRLLLALGALVFGLPPLGAATGPWVEEPEVKVRLVSGWSAAPAATSEVDLDLGLEFALAPGWHVYWKNSGDAGYAPKLDLSATSAISSPTLLFPAPHRFDLPGDLVSFGYEGEVIYPVAGRLRPAAAGKDAGVFVIAGRLDYLVCAEECIPYTADLRLELPPGGDAAGPGAANSTDRARLERWRRALPLPLTAVTNAPRLHAAIEAGAYPHSTLEVAFLGGGLRAAAPALFFESHPELALGRPELVIGSDGLRFRVPIRPLDETRPAAASASFAWTLTGLEGASGPVALEGTLAAAMPSPAARTSLRSPLVYAVAGAILLALTILYVGRRRGARSTTPTQEER